MASCDPGGAGARPCEKCFVEESLLGVRRHVGKITLAHSLPPVSSSILFAEISTTVEICFAPRGGLVLFPRGVWGRFSVGRVRFIVLLVAGSSLVVCLEGGGLLAGMFM